MVYQIAEKNYIDSVKIDIAEIAHEGNYDPHSYYSRNVLIQCRLILRDFFTKIATFYLSRFFNCKHTNTCSQLTQNVPQTNGVTQAINSSTGINGVSFAHKIG